MITCRTATELHTAAGEDALGGWWRRWSYRFHMNICPACQAYAKGLEQTVEALGEVAEEKAPEGVKQAALAKLRRRAR